MKKLVIIGGTLLAPVLRSFAEGESAIVQMQTAATTQITAVSAAVVIVLVAGFGITAIFWAARKMRGGMRAS